jgi:hypothetical protein
MEGRREKKGNRDGDKKSRQKLGQWTSADCAQVSSIHSLAAAADGRLHLSGRLGRLVDRRRDG